MATKQEIIDRLSQCGGLSYQDWIRLLDSIYFDSDAYPYVAPIGNTLPTPESDINFSIIGDGSYSYQGGVIPAKANYMRIVFWNGSVWSVVGEVQMPKGVDGKTIELFNPNKEGGYVIGSQVFYNNKVYEVVIATNKGENPESNIDKFKVLLGNTENLNFSTIYTANVVTYSSMDVDTNGDVYIVCLNSVNIRIFKNGEVVKNQFINTDNQYFNGLTGLSCKILNNKIEILINSFNATWTENGLLHVTYDIASNTITKNGLVTTGQNEKLNVYSIVEKAGILYTAVNANGVVVDNALNPNVVNFRIELFKFQAGSWSKVNTIAVYDEVWGARFTKNGSSTEENSLRGFRVSTSHAVLFLDANENFAVRFKSPSSGYVNRIFKKTFVNGEWRNDYIENNYKSFITHTYLNRQNQERLIHKRYTNPTFTWSQTVNEVTNERGKIGFRLISQPDDLVQTVIRKDNYVYILMKSGNAPNYHTKFTKVLESVIDNGIEPKPNGAFRGNLLPSQNVNKSILEIGDYFELNSVGTYQITNGYSMDGSNIFPRYIKLKLDEKAKSVWNGNDFYLADIVDNKTDIGVNIPFEGVAVSNIFSSDAFRIPTLLQCKDKSLIAMTDARYTSADDYTEMDVVVAKSYDNGKTWTNYQVVFERTQKNVGWRIHDGAMVLDNNPNSPQYGRIWAFAKEWQANVSPADQIYWDANRDKLKFFMRYSDDNGLTWSPKQEFPLIYLEEFNGWSTGCATGITMTDGTLVLPVYWNRGTGSMFYNRAGFIYKTVGGTWQVGDLVGDVFTNENQIIQDVDGKLIMNARHTGGFRKVFSLDSIGAGWVQRPEYEVFQDVSGGCQASFVRYRNTYLFSQPTSYGGATRSNIKVFYSYDKINWKELIQLTSNPSAGYTELEVTDTTFGILVETTVQQGFIYSISYFDLTYLRNILI